MTVRGPVAASDTGYTLSHEHILCDLWKMLPSYDVILDDEQLAIEELAHYKAAGGKTVMDVTTGGLNRNPAALRRIAEATDLNIVMGAGWYREIVYPPYIFEKDTNALADQVVEELTVGMDGTDVCAGVIGEIGTERHHISPAQERVFRACARAQRRTGVAFVTHTTHFGELALEQIGLLREEGVPPDRIMISHLGDRYETGRLMAIAREGVYLSIDNIGYTGQGYPSDEVRAGNVGRLIAEGYLSRIVLGGDVCTKQHLAVYGGKGYAHVPVKFLPLLRAQGVSEEAIHQMTVENPARLLEVPPSEPAGKLWEERYLRERA